MHCSHTDAADYNGATRNHGRRRNKVSETRLPSMGYVEARGEEQNPIEASICRKVYPGMPGIICHDAHAAKAPRGYESSDVQSLDDSIVRAEMIDADLDAPTPESKILRREEEVSQSGDACRGRRYGTVTSFSTRGETHYEASGGLAHKAAWDPRSSQAHKLAHEINDRLNQSEVQMRRLREERDNAVHELMTLSGKITNCTELAEEQAKLLEEQSETISKLETKIQVLEKAKHDARHEQKKKAQALDNVNQRMQSECTEYEEKIRDLESTIERLQAEQKEHGEKVRGLEEENKRMRNELTERVETIQNLEASNKRSRLETEELIQKTQSLEHANQSLQVGTEDHVTKIQNLEDTNQRLQGVTEEQRQKLRIMEDTNQRLRADTQGFSQKVRVLEDDKQRLQVEREAQIEKLRSCEGVNQTLRAERDSCKENIRTLEETIQRLRREQEECNEVGTEKKLHLRDEKIEKLKHKMKVAKSELSKARTREAELNTNLETQETAYQQKLKECLTVSKEIQELTGVNAELREKAEAMDQLCIDNARLVQLLAESEEYQNFLKEMEEGNGLVFCPSQFKGSKFKILAQRYGALSTRGSVNPKTERENWIPADLYDLAMAFRREHSWEIAVEELKEFLRLVNTFWHEREKKQMGQTKMKYERQISEMKRHHTQRIPYEKVIRSSLSKPASKGYGSSSSKVSLESGDHDDGF
ncbi:hypothetical protein R1sor_023261 [Riccia sorocarpa]|uniref:Uncharacterized protein n=1 Tax=Riccia sorocarpa TaxID=122646 RepID=A0ABD3GQG7_9MARC